MYKLHQSSCSNKVYTAALKICVVERHEFRAILRQSVYAVLINSVLFHTWDLGHYDDAMNNDL